MEGRGEAAAEGVCVHELHSTLPLCLLSQLDDWSELQRRQHVDHAATPVSEQRPTVRGINSWYFDLDVHYRQLLFLPSTPRRQLLWAVIVPW